MSGVRVESVWKTATVTRFGGKVVEIPHVITAEVRGAGVSRYTLRIHTHDLVWSVDERWEADCWEEPRLGRRHATGIEGDVEACRRAAVAAQVCFEKINVPGD